MCIQSDTRRYLYHLVLYKPVFPLSKRSGNYLYLVWIYYNNTRIPCVCVHVCVCVCQSVISEISGTGRRSAMFLTPSWRASPGELRWLIFELTGGFRFEKKAFRPFSQQTRETTPFTLQRAILKKLVVFLKGVEVFPLQMGRSKKEERPRCLGSFAKTWWKLWRSGKEL